LNTHGLLKGSNRIKLKKTALDRSRQEKTGLSRKKPD
jgi:hypothetical protein